MSTGEISERASVLLKALVEHHIREGQPVGSSTLRKAAGLPVSAATIRNVMSDLEERGYLHSPHTSAGRVPTALGYRVFGLENVQRRPNWQRCAYQCGVTAQRCSMLLDRRMRTCTLQSLLEFLRFGDHFTVERTRR